MSLPLSAVQAWLNEYTEELRCDSCGGRWKVARGGVAVLFHQCQASAVRRPRPRSPLTPQERRQEESRQWAETLFGPLEDAVRRVDGPAALWRDIDDGEEE